MVQAQFALAEGLPAFGLAVVAGALALTARRAGRRRLSLITVASGAVAAVISVTQYALGVALASWALPGHATGAAGALFAAVNRLDGAKMLALAVLGLAVAALAEPARTGTAGVLPRWLRYAGLVLAAAITVSGTGYLLLSPALAAAAYPGRPGPAHPGRRRGPLPGHPARPVQAPRRHRRGPARSATALVVLHLLAAAITVTVLARHAD